MITKTKGFYLLLPVLFLAVVTSCVKETYEMDKLSSRIGYKAGYIFPGASGSVTLSDLIEEDDTLFFDEAGLLKMVFRQDSVFNINLEEFIEFGELGGFSEEYTIGDLGLDDVNVDVMATLGEIVDYMGMGATFEPLDGATAPFPPIPGGEAGTYTFEPFTGLTEAELESGLLTLSVVNTLPVDVTGLRLRIINQPDGTNVIDPIDLGNITADGGQASEEVDLAGVVLKNPVEAVLEIFGTPGSVDPVEIDLQKGLDLNFSITDLQVASATAALPDQLVVDQEFSDTFTIDLDEDFQLTEVSFESGKIDYTINSTFSADVAIVLDFSTGSQGGASPLEYTITATGDQLTTGSIDLSDALFDLTADAEQPYNKLPVDISASVNTEGSEVYFENTDKIEFDFSISDFEVDLVKGYFSNKSETLENDSIEIDIEEITDRISGDFTLSNPSVRLEYEHTFGIPLELNLGITAVDSDGDEQSLNADPIVIDYSSDSDNPLTTSTFVLDRNNSDLPDLVSMLPSVIRYQGSAELNPDGNEGYTNFIFGDSRFLANLEIEVPFEFRMQNFAFNDTIDNELEMGDEDEEIPVESLELRGTFTNGFPVGASIVIQLYDSVNQVVLNTIDMTDLLVPGTVDGNGRVIQASESTLNIPIDQPFIDDLNLADEIIISFELNTSGDGTQDVKIYSDYSIDFDLALRIRVEYDTYL